MDEDRYKIYFQPGKKYRTFHGSDYWDVEVTKLTTHPDGGPWVEHKSMKNNSGVWLDDGSHAWGFLKEIEEGKTIEIG